MKKLNKLILLCLMLVFISTANAQTTVFVNPGQSIQSAVNAATPGTTIVVRAGTYNQKVLFSSKNGTSGNFIKLQADAGVILSGTGLAPSGREGLITIRNSNYIRVEGFDVQNFITGGGQTPCGILVEGFGTKLEIVNNKVHNIRNNNTCTDPCSEGAHGIAVFGTSTQGITDIILQGNEVYGNVLQASESVVINGNVDRFQVLENNVHNNNNIGFDFIGYEGECSGCGVNDRVRNGIVRGNIANGNSSTTNPWYSNSGSAGGFYVDGGQYIVFERNISTGNDLGFEFASEHPNKATEDILMSNNFIYNNKDVGVAMGGYASGLGEARRIQIYNNSFYSNKGFGTEVTLQYKVINCQFANNIFYGKSTAAASYESIGTGSTGNVWGTNMWWGTSSTSTGLPGTKIIQNPQYVSPASGNLNIQSTSPAINAGLLSPDITTWTSSFWDTYYPPSGNIPVNGAVDINNEPRIQSSAIDLGADEFGGGTVTIPSAPSALTAAASSTSQINISWTDNANNETGFAIERSLSSTTGFAPLITVSSNVTSYQNTGLSAGTTYYYRVTATNSASTSAYSNVASATTVTVVIVPSAPTALTATASSASQINISWTDNANNETGFAIERSLSSTTGFAPITTVASNVTSYQNTGLSAATTYYYRVTATNSAGASAYSNEASATTLQGGGNTSITIDGNTGDWSSIVSISTNGIGGLTSLKAYSDATDLYILAEGTTSTNYIVFINKDNVSTTGYTAGLWSPEGSDYYVENGVLYKYNGTGGNWQWSQSGVSQTGIASVKTGSAIELKIPKASIVGLGTTIKLGVDSENSSWTTVATIPSEEGAMATYTLGANRLQAEAVKPVMETTVYVYPNPSITGTVRLAYFLEDINEDIEISIYNQAGYKVMNVVPEQSSLGNNEITLQLTDLPSGFYSLHLRKGNSITFTNVLLQK